MANIPVLLPQMGESVFEATINSWAKKEGDSIKKNELLFEISTDKVDTEVSAPIDGVLVKIVYAPGTVVKVGDTVAFIKATQNDENCPTEAFTVLPDTSSNFLPQETFSQPLISSAKVLPSVNENKELDNTGRLLTTPLARLKAKELGVPLALVKGSGPGGRILREDVEAYIKVPVIEKIIKTPVTSSNERFEIVPMTAMRKKIADHMVMSKKVSPHVLSVVEINVQKIVDLKEKHAKYFLDKYGAKLSYTPFLLKAAVNGLIHNPVLNTSVDEGNIIYKKDINLGVAVALDSGLIVPVIKQAQNLSFAGLASAINDLASRARNKKLSVGDVQDGTFSVTNFGVFGTLIGQPIINQPQVAILGVGSFEKKAVVINDAIAIRTMCYVSLSYDHRVVDGLDAGKFLTVVKETLENWSEEL